MTGRVVAGRYELIERLGRGAMGEVWRARDDRLQRDVAVKLVDLTAHDATVAERFQREAITTARLNSPHIVAVYDAGSDDSTAWLVMELLEGRNIADLIREQGRLDQAQSLEFGAQVATGLASAHEVGVTHRDIKPANVMVHRGTARIVDFGIARLTETLGQTLTAPATVIGTAAYMSPEQALGKPAGSPSDVYSLGSLLFAMLTGDPPFRAESAIAVARAHVTDEAPTLSSRLPECPPALDRLVSSMLAKEPSHRPSARDVAQALRQIAADPGVAPTALPPTVVSTAVAATVVMPSSARTPAAPATASTAVMPAMAPIATQAAFQQAPAAQPVAPAPVAQAAPVAPAPRSRSGLSAALATLLLLATVALVGLFVWPGWALPKPGPVETITPPAVTVTQTMEPSIEPTTAPPATTAPPTTAPPTTAPPTTAPPSTQTTAKSSAPALAKEVADVGEAIAKVKNEAARKDMQATWAKVAGSLDPKGGIEQLQPIDQLFIKYSNNGTLSNGEQNQLTRALNALTDKLR